MFSVFCVFTPLNMEATIKQRKNIYTNWAWIVWFGYFVALVELWILIRIDRNIFVAGRSFGPFLGILFGKTANKQCSSILKMLVGGTSFRQYVRLGSG